MVTVDDDWFKIHIVAYTHEEAFDDYRRQLRHFRAHYKALSIDKVTGEAKELKQRYAAL